ncbi:hypothetical protein [Geminocystis sp. NIES-3709]|uniref:hypothetical protein n=1 Tax=Geminocystis sp. NIES-3709 TaxID=1617448 RepID=UPI0005FC407C|nr:hypothetical protein [Geminocystis sp. NIES-3709]BAQ65501.1 hypothetical protein GM3709_2266 [Geminocystis sp. NIES-3709]
MKRNELEQAIIEKNPNLKQINLLCLSKKQLEEWVNLGQITMSSETLVKIFLERNERAEINQKLNRENFGLRAKLTSFTKTLTDWSKSELIQQFKHIFGTVKKADDVILKEIGAVSKESVREDLEKAEEIINEAQNIAMQYQKKYGKL